MKTITSRDNPLFKKIRGLALDSREIRKQGKTLLDGPHLVEIYRRKVGHPEFLIVSESGLALPEVGALLVKHDSDKTLCLKDGLFKELAPTETPVGVLAVIAIPVEIAIPVSPCDCVLLDAMQDAGNVGAIIRSALAFGIQHVYLGMGCAGAWTPKVLRAAQGAHFSLHIHERVDLGEVLSAYQGARLATVVDTANSLYAVPLSKPIALVIGNEGQGLSPHLVSLCDYRVTIPMSNECESLNAAVAASICMSEMSRQKASNGLA